MIADDHAGLQTLPVFIRMPICVDCNFCSCDLIEALIEVASSKDAEAECMGRLTERVLNTRPNFSRRLYATMNVFCW